MPRKKRYNVRFPPGRIKRIMRKNPEVGKLAMAVPVLISKILELFARSLVERAKRITQSRNGRTLQVHHLKEVVDSDSRLDFLKETVQSAFTTAEAKENHKRGSWPRHRRRWQDTPAKTKAKREEAPKLPPEVAEIPIPPTDPTDTADPTDPKAPTDTTLSTDTTDPKAPTDTTLSTDTTDPKAPMDTKAPTDPTPPTLPKAPMSPKKRPISTPLYEDDSSDSEPRLYICLDV